MWVPGNLRNSVTSGALPAEAGSFGAAADSTGTCQSSKADCPSISPLPAAQGVLPFSLTYESTAVLWLSPLPVSPVLLLHSLCGNRSDLCKTSWNALESDLLPALPFHKANFHQHCIWSLLLTFRWCSVNSWPACGSWFSESVSQGVLAPSVLQSWSIIIWLLPSKQFVFSTAKRVLPRWSSPWLLGIINVSPSDWYWDPLLLGAWKSSAFLPLFCFLLPQFMCSP